MLSNIKALKILQIIYIICIISYVLLFLISKFNSSHDIEGLGLLWGVVFGNILVVVILVLIIYSIVKIKQLKTIDWVFLLFSLALVTYWLVSTIIYTRGISKQVESMVQLNTPVTRQISGMLYEQEFTLPVNYFSLNTLVSMFKKDTNSRVDARFTDDNFPTVSEKGKEITMELMSFSILANGQNRMKEITKLGYRPANINEFIAFVWNEYETLKQIQVSTEIASFNTVDGSYLIPVFSWNDGIPQISLRNQSDKQNSNEYSLVVKLVK